MIEIINKDITTVTSGCILHQVNCFTMGSGVAKALMDKFPSVYTRHARLVAAYKGTEYELLGVADEVKINENLSVFNLFGQYDYGNSGRYTEYGSLYTALGQFYFNRTIRQQVPDVYIPYKLGSDRGGAKWEIVEHMINKVFGKYKGSVYICKLP